MRVVSRENAPTSEETRAAARAALLRKIRLRAFALEPLEPRTLLASTLPAITTNPSLNTLMMGTTAGNTGNQVNPPTAPILEAGSDTGTFDNDGVTKDNNSKTFPAPIFDAGTAVNPIQPGVTIDLYRAPVTKTGTGTAVLVDTVDSPLGGNAVPIADTNGGNGTIPDGTYVYTDQLTSLAGVTGQMSPGTTVTFDTDQPNIPTNLVLDTSNPGNPALNQTTNANPVVDLTITPTAEETAFGLPLSVSLVRDNTVVATTPYTTYNTTTELKLTDGGTALTEGPHTYQAYVTDVAGNTSVTSAKVTITVNTAAPVLPTVPTDLALAPSSDSGIKGDRITDVREPSFTGYAQAGVTINLYDGGNTPVGTAVAAADGSFTVKVGSPAGLGAPLTDGYYAFVAQAASNGQVSAGTASLFIKIAPAALGDFTGNGNTQPALYRQATATAGGVTTSQVQWFVQNDAAINPQPFGNAMTDVPLVGDFTGDGRMDLMHFTPTTGNWTIESLTTNYTPRTYLVNFGGPTGGALVYTPVPADYNGNGTESAAVYQTNTGQWYIQGQAQPHAAITPPQAGDIPVPGDYDNTGKAELAIYRPSTATWYIQGTPANPNAYGVHVVNSSLYTVSFGGNGEVPVPASYFATASDHSVQEAVWSPTLDEYLIRTANGGTDYASFAIPDTGTGGIVQTGDIPAPGDYLGTGVVQPAVYRPGANASAFYVGTISTTPGGGTTTSLGAFGGTNFIPLLAPYSYRALKSGGGTLSAFSVKAGSVDFASTATQLSLGTTSTTPAATPAAKLATVQPAVI